MSCLATPQPVGDYLQLPAPRQPVHELARDLPAHVHGPALVPVDEVGRLSSGIDDLAMKNAGQLLGRHFHHLKFSGGHIDLLSRAGPRVRSRAMTPAAKYAT